MWDVHIYTVLCSLIGYYSYTVAKFDVQFFKILNCLVYLMDGSVCIMNVLACMKSYSLKCCNVYTATLSSKQLPHLMLCYIV